MDFHRRPGCPFQFLVRFSGSPIRIKHLKNSSHATSSAKSDQYSHTVQLKKRTIHTQKLAGSSPVVFAKKNLISREIRFFSLLFAYLQCHDFFGVFDLLQKYHRQENSRIRGSFFFRFHGGNQNSQLLLALFRGMAADIPGALLAVRPSG